MTGKTKPLVISCSVLTNELKELVKTGAIDVDLAFYSMELHSDYDLLEKNLRKQIETSKTKAKRPVVVVTGDYCLGPEGKAKKLMDECGVVKVDAVNCLDCLLGGKGQFSVIDPDWQKLFLSPGWIPYFYSKKKEMEGTEFEENFRSMFSGLKGIVLLDTLRNLEDYKKEIAEICSFTRLPILETKKINLNGLRDLVLEAVRKQTSEQ